jgi:hypothetical protein
MKAEAFMKTALGRNALSVAHFLERVSGRGGASLPSRRQCASTLRLPASCQWWTGRKGNTPNVCPSTRKVIAILRLCAFASLGSPLRFAGDLSWFGESAAQGQGFRRREG